MAATQQVVGSVRNQRVIVEYHVTREGSEWFVAFDDGQVRSFDTADQAAKSIRFAAKKGNRRATVTTIEWRNVPDGFKPPAVAP